MAVTPMTIDLKALGIALLATLGCVSEGATKAPLSKDDAAADTPASDATPDTPPSDTGALGTKECARSGRICAASGCSLYEARRVDRARTCLLPKEPVVCSTATTGHGGFLCAVRIADGEIFSVTVLFLKAPEYSGWRECTDAERATLPVAGCP